MPTIPKLPFYIIESKRPFYVVIDPRLNTEYKGLLEEQAKGTLPKPNPMKVGKAYMYQTPEMLEVEVFDEDIQKNTKVFREEVILAQADARGRIHIDKDNPKLAQRVLDTLRLLDASIALDPSGWLLTESDPAKRNLGGRPRKQA